MRGKGSLKVCITLVILTGLYPTTKQAWAKYGGGSGTKEDPYLIATSENLNAIGLEPNDWDKYFILTNDINMADYTYCTAIIAPDINNILKGFQGTAFTGNFDGNGRTISSVFIDDEGGGNDYLGLFGNIQDGSIVKNLKIEDANITGRNYLGGLCGYNYKGLIANCYASGFVKGAYYLGNLCGYNDRGTIQYCHSTGSTTAGYSSEYLGGMCGYNYYGMMSNCCATCLIIGDDSLGGLCGKNDGGTINNCSAGGSVTECGYISWYLGGLCGHNYNGAIDNCYATGSVKGTSNLGGLCGINWFGTINNCYAMGDINIRGGRSVGLGGLCGVNRKGTIGKCCSVGSVNKHADSLYIGGFCGWSDDGTIINCYFLNTSGPDNKEGTPLTDTQMKQKNSFLEWDFTTPIWTIKDNDYPRLWWEENILYVPGHYSTIQAAIDAASYGDTIKVAEGTYVENITLKNGVALIGQDPNNTVIDGNNNGSVVTSLNCDPNTILDSFTITNGSGTIDGLYSYGGGMRNDNSSPKVINCTFNSNSSDEGGGMFNCNNSNPSVSDCTFSYNSALRHGGGVYNIDCNPTFTECMFNRNSAIVGGGVCNIDGSPQLINCIIHDNLASATSGHGGGISLRNSDSKIVNCIISENIATGKLSVDGGGISCVSGCPKIINCRIIQNALTAKNWLKGTGIYFVDSSPIISGSTIAYNSGEAGGPGSVEASNFSNIVLTNCYIKSNSGGIEAYGHSHLTVENSVILNNLGILPAIYVHSYSNLDARNCLIAGNSTTTNGCPGILLGWESLFVVQNCTIVGNISLSGEASAGGICYDSYSSSGSVLNSIVWNNWGAEIAPWYPNPTVSISVDYSNIEGGYYGEGNIDVDPLFVDLNNEDFHLLPESLCIDAGDPNSDFGLEPEPDGGRINMGAYGNTPEATCKGGLVLQSYNRISRTRVGREIFDYEFTITLNNNSDVNVSNVQLELLDASENVTIIDSQVSFAYIAAGQAADSDDTFIIQVDRSVPIDVTKISWRAIYEANGFTLETESLTRIELDDAIAGDISGDGEVDLEDLWRLAEMWLWMGQAGEIEEDIFADGIVNLKDFAEIAGAWRD